MPFVRHPAAPHPIAVCLDALTGTAAPHALWIESFDPRHGRDGLVASFDDWRGGDLGNGVGEALHTALRNWVDWFERETGTTDVAIGRFSLRRRISGGRPADASLAMLTRAALARRLPAAEWRVSAYSYAFCFTNPAFSAPSVEVGILRPESPRSEIVEAGEAAGQAWAGAMARLLPGIGMLRLDLDLPPPTGHAMMSIARALHRAA